MPKKLPVISGKKLISFLNSLNDILTKIAIWNQISKDALIEKLKA